MEAVKILMPRIQRLDPVNASSIMCNILMQAGGENEIIRLAFVPEAFLLSYINKVKVSMGIASLDVPYSGPPSPPIGANSNAPYPQGIMIPNNGFHLSNPPNFSSKPISYADVLSGSGSSNLPGSPGMGLPYFGGGDDLHSGQDQLEETMREPIVSPGGRSDSIVFPYGEDANAVAIPSPQSYPYHKRSFSVNDAAFLSNFEEAGGFGWRPCVYYARGYCKNGSSCKFVHGDIGVGESQIEIGSPSRADSGFDEMLRFKALQQQQQQHQKFSLMASGAHHSLQYNKWMNYLTGNQRNDFSTVAFRSGESSCLRQIYLTFPADSTFKEEDVFRYFSKFGPVHDVRIPYQQKRMFGFVTFFLPETVRLILEKGNPHFVCDSRVLVKPYKEKGKIVEKKQQQHQQQQYSDRGDFAACLSPSGIDSNELGDLPIGPRMLHNTQEMMRRKKMEQEMELQHAIELQGQRMMNLQIMDRGNQQLLPSMLGGGVPIPSPMQSQMLTSQKTAFQDVWRDFDNGQEAADHQFFMENGSSRLNNLDSYSSDSNLEHALPENLFASPTKSTAEQKSIFSHSSASNILPFPDISSNNADMVPSGSSLASASSQTTSH